MAASLGKLFRGTSGIEALEFRLKKLAVRVLYAICTIFPFSKEQDYMRVASIFCSRRGL